MGSGVADREEFFRRDAKRANGLASGALWWRDRGALTAGPGAGRSSRGAKPIERPASHGFGRRRVGVGMVQDAWLHALTLVERDLDRLGRRQ